METLINSHILVIASTAKQSAAGVLSNAKGSNEITTASCGALVTEIASLHSRPEGWRSHPEEVPLGCNDD